MIKRLITRILDRFAGMLVRVPPIYARMLREITANPQAFHQVLNEDKVFKRIRGQKGFLNQIVSDPKTVNSMLKDDAVLESFFSSRTAPATIRNWLETRDAEKAPPFFKAAVSAMLQDDEMLDLLLGDKRFIERVTLSIEALERVDPFGLDAPVDDEAEMAGMDSHPRSEPGDPVFEISPELLAKRSERATRLLSAIASNAPSSYLRHFVLDHDDLLTEILTSHTTADELLRNAGAYLSDITFTAEHRRSLYHVMDQMVLSRPREVAREIFQSREPALTNDFEARSKFLDALVKNHRGLVYTAMDAIWETQSKDLYKEYLNDKFDLIVTGPMKQGLSTYMLANLRAMGKGVTDYRKAQIISDLTATMKGSSMVWVIEDVLEQHPEAASQMARMPQIVEYYSRDGWTNLIQRAASTGEAMTLSSLFSQTAHEAPASFLEDFVSIRPDWTKRAADTQEIREAVINTLGEEDGAVLRDQMFETESLLRELTIQMPDEAHARISEVAELSTALRKLAEFVPAEDWRKGVRAAARAKVPSLAAFWGGIEQDGEIPLLDGKFRMPSRTDMAMITDEILLREEYFLSEYGPEDKPYIIDCGTNIGLSIVYMKGMYPNATVLGFEPVAELRELAEANMTSLGFEKVTILPNAIAGEAGRRRLRKSLENTLAGSITDRMDRKTGRTMEDFVEAKTLSEFIKGPVDFIKLDIEGVEHEVFLEAKDKLHMVRYIFCEFHYDDVRSRQKFEDILKVLAEAGFVYHIARTPWAEERYAHRPLSFVGQAYSVSIYAKNTTWPPQNGVVSGK